MTNRIMRNPLDSEALTTNDVVLVPRQGVLPSRSDAQMDGFLYSAPMDTVTGYKMTETMVALGQMPVVSRFLPEEERLKCLREFGTHEDVFFAIGFNDITSFLQSAEKIAEEEAWPSGTTINFALDVAHGDMTKAHKFTETLRKQEFCGYLMSGSICTPDAAVRAVGAGCGHLRVGVGPGAACTTRLMTGCGFPNLSAVYLIHRALEQEPGWNDTLANQVHIIADGGIKNPGDAVKYMAAGAKGVMMGSVFSKAEESAGWTNLVGPDGLETKMKSYRGQASAAFQESRYGKAHHCPEGAAGKSFQWDRETTAESITQKYQGGMQSALSYLGLRSTADLNPDNVTFVKVTSSGFIEGTPHGV